MPGGKKRDRDERSQIAHSAGPFKGSEAYTDSCQSALMTPRLLTGDTVHPPHTPMMHLSTHLPFYRSFSLSPCFRCFTTFSLASYQWSSSPWLWRVSARTAFVSYHRPALLIRPPPPFMLRVFLFPFVCCRHAFMILLLIKTGPSSEGSVHAQRCVSTLRDGGRGGPVQLVKS